MIKNRFLWIKVTILLFLFIPTYVLSLTIETGSPWRGIFADKVVPYEIILTGKQNSYASLTWRLSSKGRVLSSGQQAIRFGSGNTVTTTLPLQTPPLKQGISIEAQLIIEVADETHSEQKTDYKSKLNIYGPDLLLTNRHFYQQLNIQLFDPIGNTAKIFDDLKIPYVARSKAQLVNLTEKRLIVVGAGVALDQQRGLIDTLIEHARNGQRVLILQPITGDFSVSDLSTNSKIRPSTMSFTDDSVVQSFAQGYDWITNTSKTHGISLLNHRQTVLAQIAKHNRNNWDWLQINFDQSGGKLIICMLLFDRYIDTGPVPQIIFIRLLAYANGQLTALTATTQAK